MRQYGDRRPIRRTCQWAHASAVGSDCRAAHRSAAAWHLISISISPHTSPPLDCPPCSLPSHRIIPPATHSSTLSTSSSSYCASTRKTFAMSTRCCDYSRLKRFVHSVDQCSDVDHALRSFGRPADAHLLVSILEVVAVAVGVGESRASPSSHDRP